MIVTPPSSTYVDEPSSTLPALRAQDPPSAWFGVASLPGDNQQRLKQQYRMWIRTAESLKEAIAMKKQWVVAYSILGDTSPTQLRGMLEVLGHAGVHWQYVSIRAMRVGLITYNVEYVHEDCEDMEDLYGNVVRSIMSSEGSGREGRECRLQVGPRRTVMRLSW